ncbi:hypothetical protein ACFOEE_05845 [Pseudoalteromonas fenneropenaei]|uniref:Uncharacterized protein n=1 Tax=Pseudoalteromonas fenneropenaei TaxID=1737459 RepID=A0ABV7CH97_9GAMM
MSDFEKHIASILSRTAAQQSDAVRAALKRALLSEQAMLQQTMALVATGSIAPKQFEAELANHIKQVLSHFSNELAINQERSKILVQTTLFELAKSVLHTYSC